MARRRFLISVASRLWPKRGWLSTVVGKRVLLAVVLIVLAAVPLAIRVVPIGFVRGEPAPRTFTAPRSTQFIDGQATQALRQVASDAVSPVYVFDDDAQGLARRNIVQFFSSVASAKASYSEDATAQVVFLADRYESRMDTETLAAVVALSPESLDSVARNVETLVSGILSARISETDLAEARDQLARSVELVPLSLAERFVAVEVGNAFLEPTFVLDAAATSRARQEALNRVSPVVVMVQEGENIVERGDIVTARDIDLIRSLGGLDQGNDALSVVAGILLMSLLIAAAGLHLAHSEEHVWNRMRDLLLLSTLLLGMMYATRLVMVLWPDISPYLMPVPLVAVFATLLVGARPAIVLTVLTTVAGLLLGFASGVQVVSTMLVSLGVVAALARLTQRSHLFYVGAFIVALLGLVSFGASLASGNTLAQSLESGAWGTGGGLLTAILMLGLLPFLEFVFGVTTDITLLELGNPSHPLLRRLMREAPGTYSHSVMTANLAETAAEAIGANPLLTRVGAYFHDVGKIRRPGFFVENQAGDGNPHDKTSPSLSARIITAHVREGVELAEEYRLPVEVVDIVRQHHGNSVVAYFYDKAAKRGGPLLEADYRYDGQRPTSREAALVMLADSVEAALRSVDHPTSQRIEGVIRRIVRGKLDDHQLDDCELTLADLKTVVAVYTRMLASVYHPRVEYPQPDEERGSHAGERHQPQEA